MAAKVTSIMIKKKAASRIRLLLFRFVKRNGYNLFLVADCFSINLWSVEDKYTSELRRKLDEMWFGWKIRSIRFIRAQKITSVCRIPISMSLEKIICVHPRNLREINTMNNLCVKNYFCFLFVILSFYYVMLW